MSSYLNFYLRVNNNFAPIGSYSRSSEVYKALDNYCYYGKLVSLTPENFNEAIQEIEKTIARMRKIRGEDNNRINLIMNAANTPLEEKLQAVNDIECNFADMDQYIDDLNFAIDTLRVYINIIDDYECSDDGQFDNGAYNYIYAGIECSGKIENVAHKE